MPTRLHDLSDHEIDLLGRLHAGSGPEEAFGMSLDEFEGTDALAAHLLVARRLAVVQDGWRGSFWLLPTEEGRRVFREGL